MLNVKLTNRWNGGVVALALAAGLVVTDIGAAAAAPANPLYSGGGTFAEVIYRKVWDCYASNSAGTPPSLGPVDPACTAAGVAPYRADVEILYSGVGSGNGKKAFIKVLSGNHDTAQLISGSRTPGGPDCAVLPYSGDFGPFYNLSGANPQPGNGETACADGTFRGTTPIYPKLSFAGSDDPLVTGDLTTYNTNSTALGWGPAKQFPAFQGGVAVAFNPPAGFNPKGKKASGGTSFVDFSRETYCGIFGGTIQFWDDPAITADNKGIPLAGHTPIEVVVRGDGSGTTFLFTNGLIHQCGSTSSPSHGISAAHALPDQFFTDNGLNPVGFNVDDNSDAAHQSNNNFFININNATHLPHAVSGTTPGFTLKNGNGGIQLYADQTPNTIDYLSGDFVQPAAGALDGNGNPTPVSANLQTWQNVLAIEAGTTTSKIWVAITPKTVAKIMASVLPPVFTCSGPGCADDPLAWGKSNPQPTTSSTYPLGGFTFFDTYTCYASASDVDAMFGQTAGNLGFFRWWFGSSTENAALPKTLLAGNSFATVPSKWTGAIKKLLFKTKTLKVGTPGAANTGCSGVSGTGA